MAIEERLTKRLYSVSGEDSYRLISRIQEISGIVRKPPIEVFSDTTNFMRIYRGHVICVKDRMFFVRGDVYEPRFGMQDQPKFWVKLCYDLDSGRMVILKLEFHEEFVTKIGSLSVPCYRSPHKEGEVLWLVRGDSRFMQGETFIDDWGNHVRVIEFIKGKTLYGEIFDMGIDHEQYYYTRLAPILKRVLGCCEAIQMLHNHGLCHGDIRNDHIMIDEETGEYRWIDFDLLQDFESFDVWRLGNVMQFVIGKGLLPFYQIRKSGEFSAEVIASLESSDAGAFYSYRVMNLKKLYPYINEKLNNILLHFSAGAGYHYQSVLELITDLKEVMPEIASGCVDEDIG